MYRLIADRPLLRGGILVLIVRGFAQLLRIAGVLVLARLLGPDAFGRVGIAMLAMAALTTITDTGFDAALVQRRDDVQPYLNTVFTVKFIRSLLIGVVLYLLSPMIAGFFSSPAAAQVLRGLIPVVLLEGLTNPAAISIRRDLRFGRIAAWDFAEAAAGFAGALLFGLWLGNVFAIVFAMIASQLARTVTSYLLAPFLPRFELNWSKAVELARFGMWVLLTNTAVFMLLYIDDVAVTKILGAAALGLYQVAFRISNVPVTEMSHVVGQLTYPAYSQVQADLAVLRRRWLGVLGLTAMVAVPAAVVISLTAADVVPVLLGANWLGIIPVIQVLAVFGALRALNAATGSLFNAVGKPRLLARISVIQLVALSIIVIPAVRTYGLTGAAWAVTAANGLALFLVLDGAAKLTTLRGRDLFRACRPALVAGAAFTAPLLLVQALFPPEWLPIHRLAATFLVVVMVAGMFAAQRLAASHDPVRARP